MLARPVLSRFSSIWHSLPGPNFAPLLVGIAATLTAPRMWTAERADAQQTEPSAATPIHLNSIGYLTDAKKLATIPGSKEGSTFIVRDVTTGVELYQGTLTPLAGSDDTNDKLYVADFSDVQKVGCYQLQLFNGATSPRFEVRNDIYNWPFYCAMKAMYLWRCGTAVEYEFAGQKFGHANCHLQDGYLNHAGGPADAHKDGVGGWHDAGDYNKYTVNSAFTVGMMLRAWEDHESRLASLKLNIPESDNNIPDYLDEVRWELDWLLKMQADDGSVYHKLSALKFCGYVMPEAEKERRYFSPWGSAATADFAAVMAQASRAYRPFEASFSDRCLTAAEKSYRFLALHPAVKHPDLTPFSTGHYQSDDADDRLWASAELWETTGKSAYLADFEKQISGATRYRT